jgi:hypothetical protein
MHRFILGTCAIVVVWTLPVSAQTPAARTVRPGTPRASAIAVGRDVAAPRLAVPSVLPGTPSSAFTTIQGNALDSTNQLLARAPVRLRDARVGRIVDTQFTDNSGLFAFRTVDPGTYVIELMSAADNSVLAASQLLSVNAGDAVSAVVKLPFRLPPFAGLLGHSAAQAASITSAAAATGVLAAAATTDVSPERIP